MEDLLIVTNRVFVLNYDQVDTTNSKTVANQVRRNEIAYVPLVFWHYLTRSPINAQSYLETASLQTQSSENKHFRMQVKLITSNWCNKK